MAEEITMPELPEVETIRSDLSKKITNKEIVSVTVKLPRLVKSGLKNFIQTLTGNKITKISRRGKLIYCELQAGGEFLLVHLKMTGQLIYQKNKKVTAGGHSYQSMNWELPNKYSHIYFNFADASQLFFNDLRTFGYMQIVDQKQLKIILDKYGLEPLTPNFTLKNFQKIFKNRKTNIKALLLNQQIIAGIGNIYADEICFYAGVLPARSVSSLREVEIKKLWRGAHGIIKKAIKERGTTFSDFRDGEGNRGNFSRYLRVFQRQGERCRTCRTGVIAKMKLAGRGTHFCPQCQK